LPRSKPRALLWGPPERSVWRAPARRSLGEGGKRAVSSVPSVALRALAGRQKRFGFRQINAQVSKANVGRRGNKVFENSIGDKVVL